MKIKFLLKLITLCLFQISSDIYTTAFSSSSGLDLEICFSPLEKSHYSLLLKWLSSKHVHDWWYTHVQWTPELIAKLYDSYVEGFILEKGVRAPVYPYIVSIKDIFEEVPIGFVEYYDVKASPSEFSYDFNILEKLASSLLAKNIAGFDIFIGEEAFCNRGFGRKIIKEFFRNCVFQRFDFCISLIDTKNTRSIRVFEKIGCEIIGKHHYTDCSKRDCSGVVMIAHSSKFENKG